MHIKRYGVGMTDDLRSIERELALLGRRLERVRQTVTLADGSTLDRAAYLLLDRIDTDEQPTLGALSRQLQLDASTVNRQVAAIERDGLVERVDDPSGGRSAVLRLTERGARLVQEARRARAARVGAALADWSATDRRRLGDLLERLNESLRRRTSEIDAGAH